jgi:hypothetical protein
MKWVSLLALLAALVARSGTADAGQPSYTAIQEAFGAITGTFTNALITAASWKEKFPAQSAEFSQATEEWQRWNPILDRVRDAIYLRARQEGGDTETSRVSAEAKSAFRQGADAVRRAAKLKYSEDDCQRELMKPRQGLYDLEIVRRAELKIILGYH